MIWIEIVCDGCSGLIVKGAKTIDGAEFIAKQKGAVVDDNRHFCNDACAAKTMKEAA